MRDFCDQYMDLLEEILTGGILEVNARTGVSTKALLGGTSIKLDLRDGTLPVAGVRRLYPKSAAAEVAWFLMGTKDVTWMRQHAPLWNKFVEDDGVTVDAAYGHRLREAFGRDQLSLAVRTLTRDPSDRRTHVSYWDASSDGLGTPGQKNVPCPTAFSLNVVKGLVHMSLHLRSSDVFVGLPYDVMTHALLLQALGFELGRLPGTLHVTLAHAHLYEPHFDLAVAALNVEPVKEGPAMPQLSITDIERNPNDYVRHVADLGRQVEWPTFNPRPELVL